MSNRHLPVSQQLTRSSLTTDLTTIKERYKVTLQYSDYVILEAVDTDFKIGERVIFDEGTYGLVVRLNSDGVKVVLSRKSKVKYAYRSDSLLAFQPIEVQLLDSSFSYGLLDVVCKETRTPRKGLTGWSLFYDNRLIAQGCDYSQHNICTLNGTESWVPGTYKIRVTSFLDINQPIRRGVREWVLTQPTASITAGRYFDKLGPLYLT